MRLHHLTLTGIGPFAGTEHINFEQLGSSGRFLLAGPTGAGKSTIIDAIVFALYGDVAGDQDSSKDRMRSRLVDPSTESVVDLTFSTTSGTYRVRRTPAYQRTKRRGTGTTRQNPTLKVWRLAGPDGQVTNEVALRPDEAGPMLRRAIGLSRDQFTQTIVLPQGKFSRFLHSSSSERHELLREVFGTHLYDEMQDWLVSQSRDLSTQAEQCRNQVASTLEHLRIVSAQSDDLATVVTHLQAAVERTDPDLAGLTAALEGMETLLEARGRELTERAERAHQADEQARRDLHEQEELSELLQRRSRLLREKDELRALEGQAQVWREELSAARTARSLAGQVAAYRDALSSAQASIEQTRAELANAQLARTEIIRAEAAESEQDSTHDDAACLLRELDNAVRLIPGLTRADCRGGSQAGADSTCPTDSSGPALLLPQCEQAATALRSQAAHLHTRSGSLEHAAQLEAQMPQLKEDLRQLNEHLASIEDEIHTRSMALEELPEQRLTCADDLNQARTAAEQLPELRQTETRARDVWEAAQAVSGARRRMQEAVTAKTQATQVALRAERRAHELRSAWISATAATLVGELEEGHACPLCGSLDHPAPASREAAPVSRTELEAAEAQAAQSREDLAAAVSRLQAAQADLDAAQEASTGLEPDAARAALEEASHRLRVTTAQADRLPQAEARAQELAARETELREHQARAQADRDGLRRQLAQMQAQVREASRLLATAKGECATVAARRDLLEQQAATATRRAGMLEEAVGLLQRGADHAVHLCSALLEAKMPNLDTVASAALSEVETQTREQALAALTRREETVVLGLREPAIARLTGQEKPDVNQAVARQQATSEQLDRAIQARGHHQAWSLSLKASARTLREQATELAHTLHESAALVRLAATARGDNPAATPLSAWVLAERFNDVMSYANARLSHMSGGRYELVPQADEQQSARRRGLGLGVRDHLAGGVRDPRTLSGGESFYVALALALALADVVAAQTGGVRMDTLFIDEGFGSLDPETLESVLAELTRLQDDGRVVGIVSHVAELRRQIPDQIVVSPGVVGSRLRVVGA